MIQAVVAKKDVVVLRSALRPSLDEYKARKFNTDPDGISVSLFTNSLSDGIGPKNYSDTGQRFCQF